MLASSPLVPVIIRNVVSNDTQSEQHQKKGRETVQRLNNLGEQIAASLVLISRNSCKSHTEKFQEDTGNYNPRYKMPCRSSGTCFVKRRRR